MSIKFHYSYSDQVTIGDEVFVRENNLLSPGKVIGISTFEMQGDLKLFCDFSIIWHSL